MLPMRRIFFETWKANDRRGQAGAKVRIAPPARDVAYRDGDGLLLTNQHYKPPAVRDAGVEQITLQHGVVLRHDRNQHG